MPDKPTIRVRATVERAQEARLIQAHRARSWCDGQLGNHATMRVTRLVAYQQIGAGIERESELAARAGLQIRNLTTRADPIFDDSLFSGIVRELCVFIGDLHNEHLVHEKS